MNTLNSVIEKNGTMNFILQTAIVQIKNLSGIKHKTIEKC